MKKIKNRTSILLAGFFNGINFFCFSSQQDYIANLLSSDTTNFELSGNNGFQKDINMLNRDWVNVRTDLMTSYNSNVNESAQQ